MGQVRDRIGAQGAAAAGVLGPAEHSGFEEGAIDDRLTAALEQIEQAYLALGSVELVLLLHRHPRHSSTLSGQRVTGAGQGLLLHEQQLARNLPLLRRYDRRCFHSAFLVLHFLLACCHIIWVWLLFGNELPPLHRLKEALLVLINMEGPVLLEMLREVNCPQP